MADAAPGQRRQSTLQRTASSRSARTVGRGRVRRPALTVEVVMRARVVVPGLRRWLETTAPAGARGHVTVAVVGDRRVQTLNQRFRGVGHVTDVLSFPAEVTGELGDIVIAAGVARRQAEAAGHPLPVEIKVLALHGLLHLLGYDHERDDGRMARAERRLRKKGGLRAGLIERGSRP